MSKLRVITPTTAEAEADDTATDIDINRHDQEDRACDPPTSQPPPTKRIRKPAVRKVDLARALQVVAQLDQAWRVRISDGDIIVERVGNPPQPQPQEVAIEWERLRDLL